MKPKVIHKQAFFDTYKRILLYSYLLATGHNYFLHSQSFRWKLMNIYCTLLNTDTHEYKVTSPGSGLNSLGGNQGSETGRASYGSINTYTQTHYINNMTFTIYNNKRFVSKEEHFQWECFLDFFVFFATGCNWNCISICPLWLLLLEILLCCWLDGGLE